MNPLDAITKAFTSAFDAVINAELYYRSNRLSVLQAGMLLIIPQMASYLVDYNKGMGIKLTVKTEGYPLLLFVLLVVMFYEFFEPRIRTKKATEVFRLALFAVHIFAFALSLNLIYAVILQIFGFPDLLEMQIQNAASLFGKLSDRSIFSIVYGIPFLLLSIAFITWNSFRRHRKRMKIIVKASFFWRTLAVAIALAVYQYMAFILIEAKPA